MSPLVSVIITTKNEERNIANCLESVLRQSYFCGKMEIIVVDNNSTDKTKSIVEEFAKGFTTLNTKLFNCGPERSAQRNFGVAQSKREYFLYLNTDMIILLNVIKDYAEKINRIFNFIFRRMCFEIFGRFCLCINDKKY